MDPKYFSIDVEGRGPEVLGHGCASVGLALVDDPSVGLYEEIEPYGNLPADPGALEIHGLDDAYLRVSGSKPFPVCRRIIEFVGDNYNSSREYPVIVAMPVSYDVPMFKGIFEAAGVVHMSPFGPTSRALDVRSYWAGLMQISYFKAGKNSMRQKIKKHFGTDCFVDFPHTHNALDDAREQAETFRLILKLAEIMREERKN